MQQSKTEHYALKTHYLSDLCKIGDIRLEYLSSEELSADLLTKSFSGADLLTNVSRFAEESLICENDNISEVTEKRVY